ncbi:YwiC-like family protein [Bacillus carboniphilus]|uniref:YwiC-like family protein n=1 Tax=Bacillus carboniphilus TaxID=86663 RepID=A0ABP3FTV6_9BACI
MKGKLVLPKEHGSWVMCIMPSLLGVFLSSPNVLHIPFLIGWFFLYLSATPLLAIIRNRKNTNRMLPWLLSYSGVAMVCFIPILIVIPKLILFPVSMIPLLAINIYYIRKKNERSLLNDLSGISIFSVAGVASYYIGNGSLTTEAIQLFVITTLYFFGSAFYIKSMIREFKNKTFHRVSHLFHGFLLLVVFFDWILLIAFLPSILKDWITPRRKRIKPIHLGILEIGLSIWFFIICLVAF